MLKIKNDLNSLNFNNKSVQGKKEQAKVQNNNNKRKVIMLEQKEEK